MTLRINFFMSLFAICWFLVSTVQAASFYERHGEGWFWYHDPKFLEEEKETPQESVRLSDSGKQKPKSLEERASETLAAYKKKLEQKMHLALVSPTLQNVQDYMRFQKDMMERSDRFSKMWQQAVLLTPDLNREIEFPTAQYARHVHDAEERKKKEGSIHNLSKTFGLFYFFRSDCSYCTAFSPIVKMFAEKYQWEVMAISLDGSPSDVFENTHADNGMAEAFNIQAVPALMAYNAQTQELVPLTHAATSLDQLEDNVLILTGGSE